MGYPLYLGLQLIVAVLIVVGCFQSVRRADAARAQAIQGLLAAGPQRADLVERMVVAARSAAGRSRWRAVAAGLALVVASLVGATGIAIAIEPRVDAAGPVAAMLIIGAGSVGFILVVLAIMAPWVLSQSGALAAMRQVLRQQLATDPSPELRSAHDVLSTGWARPGRGIGLLGAVLSLAFGSAVVALAFLGASSAISCARDPKCL